MANGRHGVFYIETILDSAKAVRAAGLEDAWSPGGTAQGFTDWLYLNRREVDYDGMWEAAEEYLRTWLDANEDGWCLDEESRASVVLDQQAVDRLIGASHGMALLIEERRCSLPGRRALTALIYLASTNGQTLGRGRHNVESLQVLLELIGKLRNASECVPPAWLQVYREQYESSPTWLVRRFSRIEHHLRERPLHNDKHPHPAVALLVALVWDEVAFSRIAARLMQAVMLARVKTCAATRLRRSPRGGRGV